MSSKEILNITGGILLASYYIFSLIGVIASQNIFWLLFFIFAPMLYIPMVIIGSLIANFWLGIGNLIWLVLGFYLMNREK